MKLRNKKTGEIGEIGHIGSSSGKLNVEAINGVACETIASYNSLAELNAEWEDYEDDLYYIISAEHKDGYICALKEDYEEICGTAKKLGIGFETKEEAEKAVEKLKAWKRLKDKGFRFDVAPTLGHRDNEKFDISIIATMPVKWWYNDKVIDDFHFVFGGEE